MTVVKPGQIYESKDKRDNGRRLKVLKEAPFSPDSYVCAEVGERPGRKASTVTTGARLKSRFRLVNEQED